MHEEESKKPKQETPKPYRSILKKKVKTKSKRIMLDKEYNLSVKISQAEKRMTKKKLAETAKKNISISNLSENFSADMSEKLLNTLKEELKNSKKK